MQKKWEVFWRIVKCVPWTLRQQYDAKTYLSHFEVFSKKPSFPCDTVSKLFDEKNPRIMYIFVKTNIGPFNGRQVI